MSAPVIATNESARLSDLRSYKMLDTDPEKSFDDLTLLASQICQTPIALITLIDADRQWFKSRVGVSIRQTAREVAFCAQAFEHSDLQIAREMKCAEGHEGEVEIALREALANAIIHGCNGDATKKIECCVVCEGSSEIGIIVCDPGEGFKPESAPSPLSKDNLYSKHGREIYLINQFMDEVRFKAKGTEIQMRKKSASIASAKG